MIKYWDYLREYKKLKHEILNSVNKVFESGNLPKIRTINENA